VVIRVSEVPVVQQPDVPHVEDLIVGASEELLEVLSRLEEVAQPDHGGEIGGAALQELASQLNFVGVLLEGCLYKRKRVNEICRGEKCDLEGLSSGCVNLLEEISLRAVWDITVLPEKSWAALCLQT
jgi:hypothetical protein